LPVRPTAAGREQRQALVLILHDSSKPADVGERLDAEGFIQELKRDRQMTSRLPFLAPMRSADRVEQCLSSEA
jgi:hypothetical protein